MVTVHTISTQLTATTAQFEAGMNKGKSLIKSFVGDFSAIGNIAAGFTLANVVNSFAGSLANAVKHTLEFADASAKVADQLGLEMEALAGIQLAGELAGTGSEELGANLIKLQKNIGDAARNGGAAAENFTKMGLSASLLAQMPLDDALQEIANKIAGIENPFERMSIATELFGKKGAKMISVLAEGSAGLQRARIEAEAYGTAISRIDAAKIEAANDAWTRAGQAWQGIGNDIAIAFAGPSEALANFTTAMLINEKYWEEAIAKFDERMKQAKKTIAAPIADIADPDTDAFTKVESLLDKFKSGDAQSAGEKFNQQLRDLNDALDRGVVSQEQYAGMIDIITADWEQATSPAASLTKSLEDQIAAVGASTKDLDLYRAAQLGASAADQERIGAMHDQLDAMKAIEKESKANQQWQKKLGDDAKKVWEETLTPLEKYENKIEELNNLFAEGFLDEETFRRALAQADGMLEQFTAKVLNESVRGEVSLGAAGGSQEAAGRIDAFRRSGAGTDKTLLDMLKENRDQTRIQRELPKAIAGELRGVIGAADF